MALTTCFVIMPIGEQILANGRTVTAASLRERYDELIRVALATACPSMDVTRADDVASPGAITTDVFTRLMYADVVVADVTFPNPNVFYELGIRHACRAGTILLRAEDAPPAPFDISSLRYLVYKYTPPGLRELSEKLRDRLTWLESHASEPDNEFLNLARLTKFRFPNFGAQDPQQLMQEAMLSAFTKPEFMNLVARKAAGEVIPQSDFFAAMGEDGLGALFRGLIQSGQIGLSASDRATT